MQQVAVILLMSKVYWSCVFLPSRFLSTLPTRGDSTNRSSQGSGVIWFGNPASCRLLITPKAQGGHPCKISLHPCQRPGALIAVPRTSG